MPRLSTLLLAFLLVALSLFGSVVAQDPAADGTDTGTDTGADTGAADPAAGDVAESPSPSPSPATAGASPGATGAAGGAGTAQGTAPGNPDGPELAVSEPSGTTVVAVGSNLTASWALDTTGTWTQTTIQFMTGPNSPMIPLQTLGTVDATTTSSFSFIVPDVNPYSQIYFLQL